MLSFEWHVVTPMFEKLQPNFRKSRSVGLPDFPYQICLKMAFNPSSCENVSTPDHVVARLFLSGYVLVLELGSRQHADTRSMSNFLSSYGIRPVEPSLQNPSHEGQVMAEL